MAADLFVSYARKDRDQVLPWVRQLQEAGVSLWIDERDIDAAHLWTEEIIDAIRACTVLLLMLSPASAASEHVVREVTFALEQHKRLLPLVLEPVELPSNLQYPLTGLQQIELFHGDPEAKRTALLRALTRLGVAAPAWQTVAPATESGERRAEHARPRHNLPQSLTRFIGREREIATATEQLAHSRLLTLTGIGGLGKTRLALEVARAAAPDYLDGVWLVELAALTEPGLVPQQVAVSLGLREEPGRSLVETLTDYLQPRQLLLVLDNCEHLVAACAQLAQTLLQACPDLRLLATSREALGVPGEQLLRLPTLGAPVPPPPPVEELTRYEAVRLFIDRALLVQPSFAVTNANAPAVAEVCHCLDGIPLAIELAAARVKLLSPEQIMGRLEDRFRLLTGGSRTALPRQQTLRAAIDWSYDLLSEGERVLLRRLSVFAGGWSLEAAEAVCAGEGIAAAEVLDLLTQLADKSLLIVEEGEAAARYRLLETIRRYGAEKVASAGEEEALGERHRDWYLALAEEADPELRGPRQGKWLTRLEAEHENLRAALAWTSERGEGEAGLRLGAALSRFWMVRGYLTEGRARLATVLAGAGSEAGRAARARALNGAGVLAANQGEYEAARALYEESLVIQRQIGDQRGIAISLNNLGNVASDQGEYEAARALHEESLAIRRELGDQQGIAASFGNLGNVASNQGEYEAARALHEESLAIRRELGDQRGIAASLGNLGNVAYRQGEYEAARALHEESLAIRRELGDQQGIANSLNNLGLVASDQGEYEAARALHEESLAIRRELGDQLGIANSLNNLGNVASNQGEYEAARALYEESLAIRRELGDQQGIANSLGNLGNAAYCQGGYEAARALYEESLVIQREIGDQHGIARSFNGMGNVASDQGEYEAARGLYEESLAIQREIGDQQGIAYNLEGLAAVAAAQGQPGRAARLYGAGEALREATGAPLPPDERADYDRHVAAARAALDEAAFAAAWAEGRALSLEQAIALALAPAAPPVSPPGTE